MRQWGQGMPKSAVECKQNVILNFSLKYKQTAISQELSMVDKFRLHIFSSHKVPKLWVK